MLLKIFLVDLAAGWIVLHRQPFLVDGEVGQMDEHVAEILFTRAEFLCCEAHQSIFVEVNAERVDAGYEHVDTKIELKNY